MSLSTETFDRTAFERLALAEPGHFWFRERRHLIAWSLKNYFPLARSFCEVGCGTGYVLAGLEAFWPTLALTGVERYPEALPFSQSRLSRASVLPGDICHLPFRDEFDAVGCFDVLEHIPDDRLAMENLASAVKPGGGLLLTVPQHPGLWSVADEIGHHQRRYTKKNLLALLEPAGLRCLRATSFVSLLLPALWLNRRKARQVDDALDELAPSALSNAVGLTTLRAERFLISLGVSFPFGGSLLVIAQKPPR